MGVQPVDLRSLDEKVSNTYEGVIVAAKQAKRYNDDYRLEYNALISTVSPRGEEENDEVNPDQARIAKELDTREKPHVRALNEVIQGQVEYRFK